MGLSLYKTIIVDVEVSSHNCTYCGPGAQYKMLNFNCRMIRPWDETKSSTLASELIASSVIMSSLRKTTATRQLSIVNILTEGKVKIHFMSVCYVTFAVKLHHSV